MRKRKSLQLTNDAILLHITVIKTSFLFSVKQEIYSRHFKPNCKFLHSIFEKSHCYFFLHKVMLTSENSNWKIYSLQFKNFSSWKQMGTLMRGLDVHSWYNDDSLTPCLYRLNVGTWCFTLLYSVSRETGLQNCFSSCFFWCLDKCFMGQSVREYL